MHHENDLLLECLVFLCMSFGRPKSAQSILAGLAYGEEGMSPSLFCEAANNMGINARIFNKHILDKIPAEVLPCVIFLKGNSPRLLLETSNDGKNCKIYCPDTKSIREVALDSVSKDFTGYTIFVKARSSFSIKGDVKEDKIYESHWFWGIVRKSKSIYGLVILSSLFINLFALVSPIFIMNVYDRVIPNNATDTGWALGIGALVAFVFDFIFRTVRGYLIDFAGRKTDLLAARAIYDHVLDMKLVDRPSSSGAFANILRNFDSVREFFTSATITALVDVPFTMLFLFFVYQLGGSIAFILVGIIFISCMVGFFIQMMLKRYVSRAIRTGQTRQGILVETINALDTIKSGLADGRFRSYYSTVMRDDAEYAQKSRFLSSFAVNITTFFQQSASVFLVLAGMYMVKSGDLTVGGLIASVILGGRAISPIGQIANLITRYHQAGESLKALDKVMGSSVERPKSVNFLHRPYLSGKIKFENVSFSYPNSGGVLALDSVSLTIEKGERVGIIGKVGSGKSTLARLLVKLYEPDSGVILADDTDYRQIDPADLRRNIAYISQDAKLFRGTVRDNITAFNPRASEDEILSSAKLSGVDDFISRHPMGYDAPVGEMGDNLSGGQRQSIAFARAIISNPRLLVCDEPTSSMDNQSEAAFRRYVDERLRGKTYIMITHKHSLLSTVDRLILLHNGKVLMDGPREEVIAALNSGKIESRMTG